MARRRVKLSGRIKHIMQPGKMHSTMVQLSRQSGEWYLGRHEENRGAGNSPLDRGFGKATTRVKKYPKYNPYYEKIRKKAGWLTQSGALKEYVGEAGKVMAVLGGFRITVPVKPKGSGPAAYAGIHQHGGQIKIKPEMRKFFWRKFKETGHQLWAILAKKKEPITIPKRKYLDWDEVDTRAWSRFATKWLNIHLGFSKSEL